MNKFLKEYKGNKIYYAVLLGNKGEVLNEAYIVHFKNSPEEKVCETLKEAETACDLRETGE